MNVQKQEKGFTIIEVVLVLAIAALIFLMIFVALPALQRGQRDTARKNDASAIASAINTYRSNSRGSLQNLGVNDVSSGLSQIETVVISSDSEGDGAGADALDTATVYKGAKCSSDGKQAESTGSSRSAAVVITLEASSNTTICTDS